MTKDFEDKSLDADIHLDWQRRTVKFENSVKLWNKKFLLTLFSVSIGCGFLVLFSLVYCNFMITQAIDYYKTHLPTVPSLHLMSSSIIILYSILTFVFIFVGAPLYDWVASHPKARGTLLKIKTRKHPYTYKIENPSGTLTFDLHRSNPLVDLEFPESISQSLESASMVKVQVSKHKSRKQMIIKMKTPATGTLLVKEY